MGPRARCPQGPSPALPPGGLSGQTLADPGQTSGAHSPPFLGGRGGPSAGLGGPRTAPEWAAGSGSAGRLLAKVCGNRPSAAMWGPFSLEDGQTQSSWGSWWGPGAAQAPGQEREPGPGSQSGRPGAFPGRSGDGVHAGSGGASHGRLLPQGARLTPSAGLACPCPGPWALGGLVGRWELAAGGQAGLGEQGQCPRGPAGGWEQAGAAQLPCGPRVAPPAGCQVPLLGPTSWLLLPGPSRGAGTW